MTMPDWFDDEAGVGSSLRQGFGLLRRGLARPWSTLLVSILLAAAVALVLAVTKRDHAPRFVLRVVEADRDPNSMPRLKRQLGEYVRKAIFTSAPLAELIRRHALYPALMRNNSRAALDSFSEDISVEVYQNSFVEERAPGDRPRSARVAVSYHSPDRALALAVTRDLGALIVRYERRSRRELALAAVGRAERARDTLRSALEERDAEVLTKQRQLAEAAAPNPRLQVELISLLGSLSALEQQAAAAERRAATLDLGAAIEQRGIGLYFDVVDDATLPDDGGRRRQAAMLTVAASFAFSLPLVAMAIGAFGRRGGQA
jgi:hypothetical protein